MDLILRAQEKREQLRAELARIEAFLATAFELEQEFAKAKSPLGNSDAEKADLPAKTRRIVINRIRGGTGADTLKAVSEILKERGQPMSTRELLPLVLAKGIEVGGNDPIATLSARISKKGVVDLTGGKWWLVVEDKEVSEAAATDQEEPADQPAKEESADSLFNSDEGGTDGTALA